MKTWLRVGSGVLAIAVCLAAWLAWKGGTTRRESLRALEQLQAGLESPSPQRLLDVVVIPAAVQNRTAPEQVEFLRKALQDELSPAGLAVLKRKGRFGPLLEVFPQEGRGWAKQAGVAPEDCVAFKLERHGVRAEVVLASVGSDRQADRAFRIVRVNNVKQLAEPLLSITTQSQ